MAHRYALASGLRGFASSELRVQVTRENDPRDESLVWVMTADLLDAGTSLILKREQVRFEDEMVSVSYAHRDGLVQFA